MMADKQKDEGAEGELPAGRLPSALLARHMDGKQQKEWAAIAERKTPLHLLELPEDILQAIIRVVTHTNDLTALALTHSTLHELVIPHIYSRFDIVWPESNAHVENRVGVDALTFGLATLVMAPDVFGEAANQSQRATAGPISQAYRKIRRGNHFAQYTKKFSLGNGPPEWVQEYLITKEVGKMLGTLVALAVGRMRNLETFIWDMPTGVLRDVWLALGSLSNRDDGQECRLDRVWVRWHDNSDQAPLPSPPLPVGHGPAHQAANIPSLLAGSTQVLFQIPPYPCVEFPTFSILPPLKSLTVLDIDELSYVEEMSVLIERSLPVLRELRVGIGRQAQAYIWTRRYEDESTAPPPPPAANVPNPRRPGGLLGIIFGRFCRALPAQETVTTSAETQHVESHKIDGESGAVEAHDQDEGEGKSDADEQVENVESSDLSQLSRLLSETTLTDDSPTEPTPIYVAKRGHAKQDTPSGLSKLAKGGTQSGASKPSSRQLQLEVLELERVDISIRIMAKAIDWSQLRQVTILGCQNQDTLWTELRKKFTPTAKLRSMSATSRALSINLNSMLASSRNGTPVSRLISAEDYPLKLQRLHTDCVSQALISFIKDTLAPDTLEWLFLQECSTPGSNVSIDTLYKSVIRRHRGSLKKLLIDSEVRKESGSIAGGWKKWVCNRDMLTAITSGKMQLRELSMSIDYQDWHFFLQRLPNAATLRSLHITHIAEHVHDTVDSRETALQVLDIVTLRPEMELCYLGVQRQCFEVVEYPAGQRARAQTDAASIPPEGDDSVASDEGAEDQEGDDDSDFEVESDDGVPTDDEGASGPAKPSFRLREILFYDDKVSIFKARHGRL
ncbi:hypothetical protein DV735_g1711, partial [Chaetothyriales sp. CBS 134920]